MEKFDSSQISLIKTNIISFQANNDFNSPVEKADIAGFKTDVGIENGYNKKNKTFQVKLNIRLTALDKNQNELPANGIISTQMIYKINNFEDFITTEDGTEKISIMLGVTLLGISYSTLRGILFAKSQETILDGVTLPIIDPINLIQP